MVEQTVAVEGSAELLHVPLEWHAREAFVSEPHPRRNIALLVSPHFRVVLVEEEVKLVQPDLRSSLLVLLNLRGTFPMGPTDTAEGRERERNERHRGPDCPASFPKKETERAKDEEKRERERGLGALGS